MSKKKSARHNREWTEHEVARLRKYAAQGMSSREAGGLLGRSMGAVKFKSMVLAVRFHAIKQPRGVQKRLAVKRRKVGMGATLRKAA